MFYSHQLLATKGAIATVWCAAHLQHKLRKSQYVSTNVPSTVDEIILPKMPIALRLSAHLLLGIVRIYSKQVDYLYEDCNEIRITINRVFTNVNVNLLHDATHAPLNSVTLPEKLDLDALDLDDYYKDLGEDSHFKVQADITLTEQIPTGKDPYIVIHFDERDLTISSQMEHDSGIRPIPMNEDVPPTPTGLRETATDQSGANDRDAGNSSPEKLPSIEIMRDATHDHDLNHSPILPDRAAPDRFLEDQINKDRVSLTPATEEIPLPDNHFSSSHNFEGHSVEHLNSPTHFVHSSPKMEIQQSPPEAQPKVRRKRKQLFDEVTVLSNRYMKNMLNDTSKICRVRRDCPSSSLAVWKQNKISRLRKEDVIFEPFITGTCVDLQALYKEHLISSEFQVPNIDETHRETNSVQRRDSNIEIEILRDNVHPSPDRHVPPFSTPQPSPAVKSNFTPGQSEGLQSELMDTTGGNVGPSGNHDSEMRTPDTFYDRGLQTEHTTLSDIPDLAPSPCELQFLEHDDTSPAVSLGTPEIGIFSKNQESRELQALSSRTRAVAQYLKRQSSVIPISEEDLSLNNILEGKTRKLCSRMFFETLVLKSHGLVEVHQQNPYGDITLKVTPKGQLAI